MRIAHLADIHLGFRQYARQTRSGINQREADVADTFRRVVDAVVAERPAAVLIAGDIFHTPRPPNTAIVFAFNQLARLRQALPETPVVMVAGNHDRPRSSDSGSILRLFCSLGVHVYDRGTERLRIGDLAIAAVPDGGSLADAVPDAGARYNVLLLHGVVGQRFGGDDNIPVETLAGQQWDYVALGDYHVHQVLAPRVAYSGAIDYTSTNPWGELLEERKAGLAGKGFVTFDLASAALQFHPVTPSRRHLELDDIDGAGMLPADLDSALRDRLDGASIDDAIVRLTVRDVSLAITRAIDHTAVRRWRRRAFHLLLRIQRPESQGESAVATMRRMSLDDMLAAYLDRRFEAMPAEQRDSLKSLAAEYMAEAR